MSSKFLRPFTALGLAVLSAALACAQRDLSGAAEVKLALDKLNVVGSVLMIAAHPDDENTAVLAYFARGRNLDTAYLSLTRGEGGQNLIGSEQGDKLGVIRTQELLAARRIDGAQQFFTRAIDFGFTKTPEETMQKWGRERTLGDIVLNIRRYRPDVVILRFSGTPRDGHGQHQTSAILGKEAFTAAADPQRFPEQLHFVKTWQARRLLWNAFAFTREQEDELKKSGVKIEIDTGEYDPLLGHSFGEIAGMSRSQHRSQGMGASERRGTMKAAFNVIGGEPAAQDPFDGIDVSWKRLPGGARVGELLFQAQHDFAADRPERSLAPLLKARPLIAAIDDPYARRKLIDLDETVALCAGLWIDANAERATVTPGSELSITLTALARTRVPVTLKRIAWTGTAAAMPAAIPVDKVLPFNDPSTQKAPWKLAPAQDYTQPYWLVSPKQGDVYTVNDQRLIGLPENPPLLVARFELEVSGVEIVVERKVENRYVDTVRGELTRPLAVVPAISLGAPEWAAVFPNHEAKLVEIPVRAYGAHQTGSVRLDAPPGWKIAPATRKFDLDAGEQSVATFEITPPSAPSSTQIAAVAEAGGRQVSSRIDVIDYPHIPPQTLIPPAALKVVRADIRTLAHKVGYIMGAGDEVPAALTQMGVDVTQLSAADVATGNLSQYDAIVLGVRVWNIRPEIRANRQRLFEYVSAGGALVVQYNVAEGGGPGPQRGESKLLDTIGPYPMKISRDRVTVEEAPVTFPTPGSTMLEYPNKISESDFNGWVQERGLYFATSWDEHYKSLLESHDPGEKPLPGGTLYTPYGKGVYIFTAYSWFRQLPAGVPGAYRIFANFLSAAKAASTAPSNAGPK